MGTHLRLRSVVLLLLLALTTAACGATMRSGPVDDATITTRVKTAFLNDPVIRAERIEVKTFKGVVTLSGRVSSKQEEEKAVAIARKIRGVTDVRSTLQIEQF
jgi:osmotically-inducible protein OsmY